MLYGDSPFSIATQMGERRNWKADSLALLELGLKIPKHLNDNGPMARDGIDLLQKLLHIEPTCRINMKVSIVGFASMVSNQLLHSHSQIDIGIFVLATIYHLFSYSNQLAIFFASKT